MYRLADNCKPRCRIGADSGRAMHAGGAGRALRNQAEPGYEEWVRGVCECGGGPSPRVRDRWVTRRRPRRMPAEPADHCVTRQSQVTRSGCGRLLGASSKHASLSIRRSQVLPSSLHTTSATSRLDWWGWRFGEGQKRPLKPGLQRKPIPNSTVDKALASDMCLVEGYRAYWSPSPPLSRRRALSSSPGSAW
jgi:hypothetical protein